MARSSEEVSLGVAERHSISLDDRGGAGYVWKMNLAEDAVVLISEERKLPEPARSGGPPPETYAVTRRFTFQAVQPGRGTATFTLEPVLRSDEPPIDTLVLEFEVSP